MSALAALPAPNDRRLAVRVTPASQAALRQGHPWLFADGITQIKGAGQPGDLAIVFDAYRRFLAVGLYDPFSPIRVRILQHGEPQTIDRAWLRAKLAAADAWRATLPAAGTTGYRLAHGENDGLPGLVVDRYDTTRVIKLYSLAWLPWLREVVAGLTELGGVERVVLRLSRELQSRPEQLFGLCDGQTVWGEPPSEPIHFTENGLAFAADVVQGQKTGFFLDQRDNRARVRGLAAGKRVLNVFAYTGGFSVYAAAGGARQVVSLDVSAPALAHAARNFALNQALPAVAACQHSTWAADAFEALAGLAAQPPFDLVVVDPPALAKQAAETQPALRAYERLTRLSLAALAPGGTLVIASCSSRVSAAAFFAAVQRAARAAGRPLVEFDRTGHAIDHPVRFPEGAYLKCVYATA